MKSPKKDSGKKLNGECKKVENGNLNSEKKNGK